jgi:hypothetical protein
MVKMLSRSISVAILCAATATALAAAGADEKAVQIIDRPAEKRVDVLIDGKPFTSYLYPATLQKPVLFPIRSARGAIVTRGFPLEPRPGEVKDHPHHVGHWFNYGEVNGFDFWGHSDATPVANKQKMGTIVHKDIGKAQGGRERGELVVRADWVAANGSTLLNEETRFVFSGVGDRRVVDRITTWTATDKPVTFTDTKEGAFGIRVARALDHPSKKPAEANDGPQPTGNYIASDGKTGEDVWGTRGPWMGLTGVIDGDPVTVAIFDHPSNHNHPTYWHARGYGLFAANPLGRKGYDPKQEVTSLTLQPGQSITFRHRILVRDAKLGIDELRQENEKFGVEVK